MNFMPPYVAGDEAIERFDKAEGEQPRPTDADDVIALHWHGEADTTPLREWAVDNMLPRRGTAIFRGNGAPTRLLLRSILLSRS